ncbi:MAG: SDR family NAD(P)-dependent oxidoreductase [Chloroflexota bacterium]
MLGRDGQRLAGKRAMVTGAASGIGRAAALRFAEEGAAVGLIDRDDAGLRRVAQTIAASGGRALSVAADVTDEAQVAAAVERLVKAWGGLDVVTGVAGNELFRAGDARANRLSLDVWRRVLDVNLTGMFLTCKHGVRALLDSGGGSVIITGSPTGLFGIADEEHAYSASKAGCHGLARAMAAAYAADGICVNAVVPGFVDTPLNARVFADPALVQELSRAIPMRRAAQPEEIAGIFAWLASDDAAYATGGFFTVDGGATAV